MTERRKTAEEIIASILATDEIGMLEYNFTDCFAALREMDAALNEIIEIYAGAEGAVIRTPLESYQQRLLMQMHKAAVVALKPTLETTQ